MAKLRRPKWWYHFRRKTVLAYSCPSNDYSLWRRCCQNICACHLHFRIIFPVWLSVVKVLYVYLTVLPVLSVGASLPLYTSALWLHWIPIIISQAIFTWESKASEGGWCALQSIIENITRIDNRAVKRRVVQWYVLGFAEEDVTTFSGNLTLRGRKGQERGLVRNDGLHNLFSSAHYLKKIKGIKLLGYVARIGDQKC
jgi:hypothetical protein